MACVLTIAEIDQILSDTTGKESNYNFDQGFYKSGMVYGSTKTIYQLVDMMVDLVS